MKRAAPIANIRSLCALRLPSEQLIPAILEALHDIIPSACNLFDWTDARGNLVRYYFEGPINPDVTRHYFHEFHNRREGEVMPAFQRVLERAVIRGASELDNPEFFRSALYNEIWKPQGLCYRVEAIIHGSRDQPLGSLVLYRAPGDIIFDKDEEALLGTLVPYIARALETEVALPLEYARRHGRRALLSMSNEGELQYVSQDAHRMLLLAHGGITPDTAGRVSRRETSPTLGVLVEQLRRNQGRSFHGASVTIENIWGRFVFEAEPLMPLDAAAPSAIHVTIHHDEPRAVAERRVLGVLPLSIAQKEVCALLHAGYTRSAIGTILSVASSTVADHVKKIYTKLDVHSVHELRLMLESLAADGACR
jgi:DNA-binding CsgD family transcriptional regulator